MLSCLRTRNQHFCCNKQNWPLKGLNVILLVHCTKFHIKLSEGEKCKESQRDHVKTGIAIFLKLNSWGHNYLANHNNKTTFNSRQWGLQVLFVVLNNLDCTFIHMLDNLSLCNCQQCMTSKRIGKRSIWICSRSSCGFWLLIKVWVTAWYDCWLRKCMEWMPISLQIRQRNGFAPSRMVMGLCFLWALLTINLIKHIVTGAPMQSMRLWYLIPTHAFLLPPNEMIPLWTGMKWPWGVLNLEWFDVMMLTWNITDPRFIQCVREWIQMSRDTMYFLDTELQDCSKYTMTAGVSSPVRMILKLS